MFEMMPITINLATALRQDNQTQYADRFHVINYIWKVNEH